MPPFSEDSGRLTIFGIQPNAERSLRKTIGPHHGKKFSFENPSGVTVDGHGNFLVSDQGQNCVVMFNPDSTLCDVVVSEGLQGPSDITILEHGLIAVADCYNHYGLHSLLLA
uniref:Uncharacterized protein n=1 Tax=Naja naja TaxID=35670 RepID=A0A8C6VSU6_NAJNA